MIHFHIEPPLVFALASTNSLQQWLTKICQSKSHKIMGLNYIFCTDDYLLEINQQYLAHDYYTDVITFDHSETEQVIEGDIFISIDRVKENAQDLQLPFEQELKRVMAHGLLHLLGFGDKTPTEEKEMRQQEEQALALFSSSMS